MGIDGADYFAARLIWKPIKGRDPLGVVDHRNRDPSDNRFDNLPDITPRQNATNQGIRIDNTSGCQGVNYAARLGKWRARIWHRGKEIHLGYFSTAEQAAEVYAMAKLAYHPYATGIWS